MAKAIIRHNLPFSDVEYEGVREVHSFLNSTVKTISRNIAKVVVLRLYHDKMEIVKNELQAIPNRICVVDPLIEHFKMIDSFLCDGDFVHIRCANHILNVVVKAGLKTIESAIFNIRESIKYIKGSESRIVKFVECIKNLGLNMNGKLFQDMCTRWNFTYLMLDSAFPYRRAFSNFKLLDRDFKCCPSNDDWVEAEKIAKFLRPFYEITILFSGIHYPTANLHFHKFWKIHMLILEEKYSEDPNIKEIAIEMEKKFANYWEDDYSPIASMAVVLDPRYKLKLVKFCFKKLDPLTCNEKVSVVEDNLRRLFKEYKTTSDVEMVGSNSHGCDGEMLDDVEEFDMFESPC
ncbi:zinc finger BED domain-containing protein RICESLEEPER 2-like [Lycium barbarum]|uniref:zinc finger BED domain-containing protein RICESLEEPER 2-like n=1 Tax=Lycium barbarum TaxID=112863 RepID=UPI00293EC1DE|nr:zinc finger BED domain-containing protein RICESLEEPER 2-like [Lycium barbarum]